MKIRPQRRRPARLVQVGDTVILLTYADLDEEERPHGSRPEATVDSAGKNAELKCSTNRLAAPPGTPPGATW